MNVYYDPEKFGLTTFGEVDFSSGSYEFDLFVVWRDAGGAWYYAEDSGCSCPMPFGESGLTDITKATPHEIAEAIRVRVADDKADGFRNYGETPGLDLIERMMAAS